MGDCIGRQPTVFARAERHQWMAWKRQQGLSSSMAMRRYTELAATRCRVARTRGSRARDRAAREALASGADARSSTARAAEQKQQQQQQQRRRARPCVSPRSRRGQQRKQRERRRRRSAASPAAPVRSRTTARAAATATERRRRRRRPPPRRRPGRRRRRRPSGRPPGSRSRRTTRLARRRATSAAARPESPRGEGHLASVPPATLAAGAAKMTDVSPPPKRPPKRCPGWNCPRRSRRRRARRFRVRLRQVAAGPRRCGCRRARARSSRPVRGGEEIFRSRAGATPTSTLRLERPPSARARPSSGVRSQSGAVFERRTAVAEAFPPPSVAASPEGCALRLAKPRTVVGPSRGPNLAAPLAPSATEAANSRSRGGGRRRSWPQRRSRRR